MAAKTKSAAAEPKPAAEPLYPVSRLESKTASDWIDKRGVYVLAFVSLVVAVALATVNSSMMADIARNTAEIELIKAELGGLKIEKAGPAPLSPEAERLAGMVGRHERDVLRIFGILGKPRELRQ